MIDTEKIRSLREKAGLTQQQAAEGAGLKTRQRWHQIESGTLSNIELATLERVAAVLKCKAKDLLK